MGRIVSNFFMSLDGVVETPDQWHFPYFNDEMGAAITDGMAACDAARRSRWRAAPSSSSEAFIEHAAQASFNRRSLVTKRAPHNVDEAWAFFDAEGVSEEERVDEE